jgi:hypothetical protein
MEVEEEKDVILSIHLTEDQTDTVAVARLDLHGDQFEATGRARRNPIDPPRPLIGEELAIARALNMLQHQITETAQDKIERFLASQT